MGGISPGLSQGRAPPRSGRKSPQRRTRLGRLPAFCCRTPARALPRGCCLVLCSPWPDPLSQGGQARAETGRGLPSHPDLGVAHPPRQETQQTLYTKAKAP